MANFWIDKTVLCTGGAGFLGSHLVPLLQQAGARVICPRSADYDLRDKAAVIRMYEDAGGRGKIDILFHLAATVGGIGANQRYPADFVFDNLTMNALVCEYARRYEVGKLVAVGSVCFAGDTFIRVNEGYKHIAYINPSDLVSGMIDSIVNKTFHRQYSGTVLGIKPFSCETLFVTPEHPFLTIGKGGARSSVQWKQAKDLSETDYLLLKIPCRSVDDTVTLEIHDVHVDQRAKNLNNVDTNSAIPSVFNFDENLAWFIGMFIAEGTISKSGAHIYLSLGDEPDVIERLTEIIEKKFYLKATIRKLPHQEGCQLNFYGRKLGRWLQEVCYLEGQRGARAKKVPDFIFRCPDSVLISFLQGCFQGDGGVGFRTYADSRAINTILYTSISRTLVYQLRDILLWFGCLGSIHCRKPAPSNINGRAIKGGTSYILKYSGLSVNPLVRMIFPALSNSIYLGERVRIKPIYWYPDMVAVPIWNIEQIEAKDWEVYNLETISHTYTANSVIVHNCAYPKFCPPPFSEQNLFEGYPEETNAPYGEAKRALLVHLQSLRRQYGLNGIYLIPTNLYGERDHADLSTSHVIPALIRKIADAQAAGVDYVEAWGTGTASRDFLYAGDCARALVLAAQRYNRPEPVNLGSGVETRILSLVEILKGVMGFQGKVTWDHSKPDGQPRRLLSTSRAWEAFGWKAETGLEEGLRKTVEWWRGQK